MYNMNVTRSQNFHILNFFSHFNIFLSLFIYSANFSLKLYSPRFIFRQMDSFFEKKNLSNSKLNFVLIYIMMHTFWLTNCPILFSNFIDKQEIIQMNLYNYFKKKKQYVIKVIIDYWVYHHKCIFLNKNNQII